MPLSSKEKARRQKLAYAKWAKSQKAAAYWAKKNAKTYGIPEPTRPMPEYCECCGNPPGKVRLHRDHCHKRKLFRGWICFQCNIAAGYLKDDPVRADKLAAYLRQF